MTEPRNVLAGVLAEADGEKAAAWDTNPSQLLWADRLIAALAAHGLALAPTPEASAEAEDPVTHCRPGCPLAHDSDAEPSAEADAPDPNRLGLPRCPCGDIAYQPDPVSGRQQAWRCAGCHRTLSKCVCSGGGQEGAETGS